MFTIKNPRGCEQHVAKLMGDAQMVAHFARTLTVRAAETALRNGSPAYHPHAVTASRFLLLGDVA